MHLADLPFAHRLRRFRLATLRANALAGLTGAAIVLPQGAAFATIAGLPPEYGLYTAMVTAAVAALCGSSMVMVSGPTTAISALVFATLQTHAAPFSARFIELALLLTLLVGLVQLAAALARLGGLVSFVSHSVITAFTAAAAVLIAVSQFSGALGIEIAGGGNALERLHALAAGLGAANLTAVAISGVSLATAVLAHWLWPRLPGLLLALLAGAAVAWILDAPAQGVAMMAAIPAALPALQPPAMSVEDIRLLAPGAAAIALVGLLEAISIGRTFALRRRERFDANREIAGQGLSNLAGSFFQCYAGSGSFTRSGVNAAAGAATPMAAVFASLGLALILLAFRPALTFIPQPAMAGLILFVAWRLVHWAEIRHILRTSRPETMILLLTFGAGLLIELDFAIYVGVTASFAVFIHQSAHPSLVVSSPVITASGRRKFRNADLHALPECPQTLVVRLDGQLYFGSVDHLTAEWQRLRAARPGQTHVIFYLKGTGRIDLAGADFLITAMREVRQAGGTFHIVALFPPLLEALRRLLVVQELGEANLHISKGEAIAAVLGLLDAQTCATCVKRVFSECGTALDQSQQTMPGPAQTRCAPLQPDAMSTP